MWKKLLCAHQINRSPSDSLMSTQGWMTEKLGNTCCKNKRRKKQAEIRAPPCPNVHSPCKCIYFPKRVGKYIHH